LELRNVGAKYSFERSHGFPGIRPNSDHRDYSRLSRPRRCSPHVPALGQFDPDQWFQFPGTFSSQNLLGRYYFEVDCMGGLRRERPRCRAAEQSDELAALHYLSLPPTLPNERIAHFDVAGACCAAGFRSGLCPKWVKRVTSVRCALDAQGTSAMPPIPTELMRHNKTSRGAKLEL